MAERWEYRIDGVQDAPVSLDELCRMIASGELKGTDEVREFGAGNWVAAEDEPRLKGIARAKLPAVVPIAPAAIETGERDRKPKPEPISVGRVIAGIVFVIFMILFTIMLFLAGPPGPHKLDVPERRELGPRVMPGKAN